MASCGAYGNQQPADEGDCEDCVKVVKTMKTVSVPCHRNEYKQYTVKVPRQVTVTVPRQEKWTDYETRTKCVPFKDFKTEKRIKYMNQKIQVPDVKTVTKMVKITRKVPKTIYVDLTTQEPKQETIHGTKTITKTIKIPYEAQVPYTNFKNITYQVPVQKQKTVMDKVCKTIYETQTRTRCEPKVTMVKKQIPVYSVLAKPPAPCPPDNNMGGGGGAGAISQELQTEFNALDLNHDGMLSPTEYAAARGPAMNQQSGYGQQASSGYGNFQQASSGMEMQASSGMEMQASSGLQQASSGMEMQASSGLQQASSGLEMQAESGLQSGQAAFKGNLAGDLQGGLESSGAAMQGAMQSSSHQMMSSGQNLMSSGQNLMSSGQNLMQSGMEQAPAPAMPSLPNPSSGYGNQFQPSGY